MKKFLTILSAGLLALASVSCVREEVAVFDESKVTPPVLLTSSVDTETSEITATFTPAVSSQNFNEKIAPSHSFAIVVYEGSAASRTVVSKKVDETTISVTQKTISKSLGALGAKDGDIVSFELAIRASIQAPSQDNGKNGYVDSEKHIQVKDYLVVLPEGSPYEEYTKDSDWSLIGAMDAYGIDWDGDLNMWAMEDGKHHVAAHVTLKKGDEVKFRKDQKWDVNMGGEMSSVGATFGVSQDGANIVIGADGVYDLFLDLETETATVEEAYDPYPDYTKASAWGVTGALSVYKISWDGDIAMACDEKEETHAAFGVSLGKEDEFKFRKDAEWTENFGGTYVALDAEFDAVADGDNIKIGAEGDSELFLEWQKHLITIIALSFGIDPKKLGQGSNTDRSTVEEQNESMLNEAIRPICLLIQDAINEKIIKRLGLADMVKFEFYYEDTHDQKMKAQQLIVDQWNTNALTYKEYREKLGLPALDSEYNDMTQAEMKSALNKKYAVQTGGFNGLGKADGGYSEPNPIPIGFGSEYPPSALPHQAVSMGWVKTKRKE